MKRYCKLYEENVIIEKKSGIYVCITHGDGTQCIYGNCRYSWQAKAKKEMTGSLPSYFTDRTSKPKRDEKNVNVTNRSLMKLFNLFFFKRGPKNSNDILTEKPEIDIVDDYKKLSLKFLSQYSSSSMRDYAKSIISSVNLSHEKSNEISQLILELEKTKQSNKNRIKEIGYVFNDTGGFGLMLLVGYALFEKYDQNYLELQKNWHGIGEWQF